MKFRIQKTEFLRGLKLAQGIADKKSTKEENDERFKL